MTYFDLRGAVGLQTFILWHLVNKVGKDVDYATLHGWWISQSFTVCQGVLVSWFESTRANYISQAKRVFCLSLEGLIPQCLDDSLVNPRADAMAMVSIKTRGTMVQSI
jgi:glucan phosphorylase